MNLYTSAVELAIENKIKPNLQLIYRMKTQGLKDRHIAAALGIATKTFGEALEMYEELKEIYDDAQILLCSRLRAVAIDRALGLDGKRDKDGMLIGPDANLAVRLLEKLDPSFGDTKIVDVHITVEEVVHQLNAKRRAELEEVQRVVDKNEAKGLTLVEDEAWMG